MAHAIQVNNDNDLQFLSKAIKWAYVLKNRTICKPLEWADSEKSSVESRR